METEENNAKTPEPSENGQAGSRTQEGNLSVILNISRRFTEALKRAPRKAPGSNYAFDDPVVDTGKGKGSSVRRQRDWDTRLFVLSTLKRMVDREHFEEMDEEDSRTPLTREALQNRKQMMEGRDQRQRRRKKEERLSPTSRLTKMNPEKEIGLNTRDKQRLEKLKLAKKKGVKVQAGEALNEALQKVEFIKEPHADAEEMEVVPQPVMNEVVEENRIEEQKNESAEQKNESAEPNAEVKEQNRAKRGFFNFNGKKV